MKRVLPEYNTLRVRKKFAITPRVINDNGTKTWIWLEFYYQEEKYTRDAFGYGTQDDWVVQYKSLTKPETIEVWENPKGKTNAH